MELRHLRYFVAVGQALNFTKRRSGCTGQPALSRQVSGLQDELGVDLLKRASPIGKGQSTPNQKIERQIIIHMQKSNQRGELLFVASGV